MYNGSDLAALDMDWDFVDMPLRSPSADNNIGGYYMYNNRNEVSYQIQLGSRVFPIMEVKTSQEAFYELMKTIGAHEMTSSYTVDILPRE